MLVDSPGAWSRTEILRPTLLPGASGPAVSKSARDLRGADLRPLVYTNTEWLPDALLRFGDLVRAQEIAVFAHSALDLVSILSDSIWVGTPAPFISPVEGGGLSAEFRTDQVELHIEIDGDGNESAYALQRDVSEWEGPLADLPDGIEKWAWRLAHGAH